MKNIILFGYGVNGSQLYRKLEREYSDVYHLLGFCDNCVAKQGNYTFGHKILSFKELITLKESLDFSVIISTSCWPQIGRKLEEHNITIEAVYRQGKLAPYQAVYFDNLDFTRPVKLYAGDICDDIHLNDPYLYGLSINKTDKKHIFHDITDPYPLPDDCIDTYQAEDVLEHIEFQKLTSVINEIYRILKPGALFRISLPDYRAPYLRRIAMSDESGNILYDPDGGCAYDEKGVQKGGHMWFPTYDIMKTLLAQSKFKAVEFYCYYDDGGKPVIRKIDYSKGYVQRTPENYDGVNTSELFTMVIDCYKEGN